MAKRSTKSSPKMQSPSIHKLSADQLRKLQTQIDEQLKTVHNEGPVVISSNDSDSGSSDNEASMLPGAETTDDEGDDMETVISQGKQKPVTDESMNVPDSEDNGDVGSLTDDGEYYRRPEQMKTGNKYSAEEKSDEEEESSQEAGNSDDEKSPDQEAESPEKEDYSEDEEERPRLARSMSKKAQEPLTEDEDESGEQKDDPSINSDADEQHSDIQRVGKITPSWYSDQEKGILRRRMGIKAHLSPQKQNEMVRKLRRIVRTQCGYSIDKPWSSYGRIMLCAHMHEPHKG
jgi:hypothetical protein